MNTLKKLHSHAFFFFLLLIFFVSAITFLLISGKSNSFLLLNSYHQPWLENLFIGISFMGDGVFAVILALILFLFKKRYEAVMIFITYSISGILAQIIKNCIRMPRPMLYFKPGEYAHFIDGVSYANMSSFPSGHTTTAFALATTLVFLKTQHKWDFLLLILAIAVGFSRIYLAQHFLTDVITGALLGTISTIFIMWIHLDTGYTKRLNHLFKK